MVKFILTVSIIYVNDIARLIRDRRIKDIWILTLFTIFTIIFGIFYLSDPYRESFIGKLFSLIKEEY